MTDETGELSPDARELFDTAACGLLRTTEDGVFVRVNRTFCAWVGHAADALIGQRRLNELLTMGGRIFHQTHWAPLLRMQGTVSEVKLEFLQADGTVVPMVVNAIRREVGGRIVHDLATFVARDRDKYERELLKMRKEASRLHGEATDRALLAEQMIGIVSHDLRNPLATIAMANALMRMENAAPTYARSIASIERATLRATRLLNDLLDFTRARLGSGFTCTREPIDLHQIVSDAVEELRTTLPEAELRHVRSGDGSCSADAGRIVQLVGNLVGNAVSYGRPGRPVTVRTDGSAAGLLVLSVHNEGDVIPAEVRPTLFEPMTRGTSAGSGSSVGLGLFIVREIAKAHGATLDVRSEHGEGTTFSVTLPR